MKINSKKIITLIIFLLVLVLLIVWTVYFCSIKNPLPEKQLLNQKHFETSPRQKEKTDEYFDLKNYKIDITDWLTYKNEKHHYQIKYPKEAIIVSVPKAFHLPTEDLSLSDNNIDIRLPLIKISETIFHNNLVINAIENPKKLSGEEWVTEIVAESKKEYDAGGAPYTWDPVEEEPILINNISAYRIVTFGFDGHYERVYIPKGKFMYELGDYPIAEENPNFAYPIELYKVYTTMISTFEFVE